MASNNLRSLTPVRSRSGGLFPYPDVNIFGTLQREIDRLFEDVTNGFGSSANQSQGQSAGQGQGQGNGNLNIIPRMDVTETENEIVITAEMPGLERNDVDISLEDDVLTIRGEKKIERDEDDQDKNVHMSERTYGVFYRVLQLPPGVDPSSVQATMSNGVLRITIPKPARSSAKKIEVKEAA